MFKKFLPHSLFGRFLLIILLPNIIVQLVAVYMFYERHWTGVSKHMSVALAGDIAMIAKSIHNKSPDQIEDVIRLVNSTMYLDAGFTPDGLLTLVTADAEQEFTVLSREIATNISTQYNIYYIGDGSRLVVDVLLPQGLLHIEASKKRITNPSTYIFIMWMTGTAVLFLIISILFMRTQVRSIINIAEAAEKFGMGQDLDDLKPSGATEVRKVAQAFIDMRDRINKHIQQRTEMLAGVSHDLKTPITRIKLQLAMMEQSKEMKELEDDIVEMEKMVQGYLDFAKGKERVVDASVNVSDLLRSVIAGYRHQHKNIELKTKAGVLVHVNSNALRRVLTNIIDNALRYGQEVKISISTSTKNIFIIFDDDGPGIPVKKRQLVFKPFYRIDSSRHLESGSTGLGLSIAKDIIVGYGGDIKLEDSPMGGLQVVVKLPF